MPPRKSDASKVATGDEGTPVKDQLPREGINVEDLNLPKSIVTRLAKGVLPPNTQIQGNAMLAMTKSATVFVNYLATHANENAMNQNRKTIAPQDVFKALEDLEFPEFRPRLEMELTRFNEVQTDKRNAYRRKVAADKMAGVHEEGEGPAAKKVRREEEGQVETGAGGAVDGGEMRDAASGEEEEGVEEEEHDEPEDEDEEEHEPEHEHEHERLDVEEQLEEEEHREAEDEALDNGDDSE